VGGPRARPSSLRALLLLMAVGAGLYVAVLAAYVLLVLQPAAQALQERAGVLATEYDSLRAHTGALQSVFDDLGRWSSGPALTEADRERVRALRPTVAALAAQSAGVQASLLLSGMPSAMRMSLAAASQAESGVAGMLLEAITDLAGGDRRSAASWIAKAEVSRDVLSRRLGDAQRLGLVDLAQRERVLGQRATLVGRGTVAWVLLGAALLGLASLVLRRRLFAPLADLDRGLARIAQGDLDVSLRVRLHDELGRLTEHFNEMTDVLRARPEVETLRRERFLVDTLMEYVPDFIYFKDAESRFLRINRAMTRWLRLGDPAEAVGKTDSDLFTPEHAAQARKDEQEIIRTGRPVLNQEEKETWPDRRVTWVSTTKMPLRDAAGRVIGTFGLSRDITERKAAQIALEKSQESFQRIFSLAPVAISISDLATGRVSDVNAEYVKLLGYARDEIVGRSSAEVGMWVDLREREAMVRAVTEHGMARDYPLRLRTRDGQIREVLGSFQRIDLDDGAGLLAAFQDITQRRESERLLQESEARFRTAFMTVADAHYIATRDEGRLLAVNDRFEGVFGYGREEVLGRTSLELNLYADPGDRRRMLDELRAQGRVRDLEIMARRKNGETIPVLMSVSELGMGDQALILGVIRDVSEQRRTGEALRSLEEQFRRAQRLEAVGRLAGGVAHDFNNILTAITGYTELLLSDFGTDDPRRGDLQEIQAAAQRAASLTRQLLAFSRKQVLQARVLDLNEVVQAIEKMLRRLIGEDVSLEFRPAAGLGPVRADPGQLEQVILNLAVNARDAMPAGGRLTIETSNVELDASDTGGHAGVTPGPYVTLAVSDTGTGMSAETLSHIFEPFFTTKEQGKGTGLGLATVHGIVAQSGGHITVHSEPDRGATFKVYLPRVDHVGEAPATVREAPRATVGRETVLVAEDDRAVREVVAATLGQRGYRVLRARDGQAALRMARDLGGRLDLLLTDIVMPGMTGRELEQALAAEHPTLQVLYMSGYTDDAVVRHGVLEEGVPYIQKPFTPDALALKVREVLDRRESAGR